MLGELVPLKPEEIFGEIINGVKAQFMKKSSKINDAVTIKSDNYLPERTVYFNIPNIDNGPAGTGCV